MKPKIIIIGEPERKREELSDKLSKFYGISPFSMETLVDPHKTSNFEKLNNELRFKLSCLSCNKDKDGFILNGMPLDLADCICIGDIDLCAFYNVDSEEIINYNQHRNWCPTCFRVYHNVDKPSLREGRCDRCDSSLTKLSDDEPRTIRKRINKWYKLHENILSFYKDRNKLLKINTNADTDKVASEVFKILHGKIKPKSKNNYEFVI